MSSLIYLILFIVFLFSLPVNAEQATWQRNSAISPDGSRIVFTQRGQLFVGSSRGGLATPLTGSEYRSHYPRWSPDGKLIAFSANIHGNDDVYVLSVDGNGKMVRLTYDSRDDRPLDFTADSKEVLLNSRRPGKLEFDHYLLAAFKSGAVYRANIATGALLADYPFPVVQARKMGNALLYQMAGSDQPWRKHQRSFAVTHLWLLKDGQHTQLTEDYIAASDPWWGNNGKGIYYLSERSGNFNVWYRDLTTQKDVQLTYYKKHPVRDLSVSAQGSLAWSWDGGIYIRSAGSFDAQKVVFNSPQAIDDSGDNLNITTFDGAEIHKDGNEAILTALGDLFAVDIKRGQSTRLTHSAEEEKSPLYLPGEQAIIYLSERDGEAALYKMHHRDAALPLSKPGEIIETLLFRIPGKNISKPVLSNSGKMLAFVVDGQAIHVLNLKSGKQRQVLSPTFNSIRHQISLAFAPDPRYLAVSFQPDASKNEIAVIDTQDTNTKPFNITQNGYHNSLPGWSDDGRILYWVSTKYSALDADGEPSGQTLLGIYNNRRAYADFLTERKSKPNYNFENSQLYNLDALNLTLSGFLLTSRIVNDKLIYVTATEESENASNAEPLITIKAYSFDLQKNENKELFTDTSGTSFATIDDKGEKVILVGGGGIITVDLNTDDRTSTEISLRRDFLWQEAMAASFEQIVRQTRDEFYTSDMNGVKWDEYANHYRRFLPSINNSSDYTLLLEELAGELNVSHTWGVAPPRFTKSPDNTASLGATFQERNNKIIIDSLLPGGPLDIAGNARAGDILQAFNGENMTSLNQLDRLLNHKAGENIQLTLISGQKTYQVNSRAINQEAESQLLLSAWVHQRRDYVHRVSKGRVGYIYIPAMDSDSYRDAVSQALGIEQGKEALIVDVRFNAGGFLANTLVEFLSGSKDVPKNWPRSGIAASDAARRQWTKPTVLLVNADSYSEGSAFPRYYDAQKLGPVVGEPVPGTGTTVFYHSSKLIPGLSYGIPTLALRAPDGSTYENTEQQPHRLVRFTPADLVAKRYPQLDAAIEEANKLIDVK